MKETRPIIIPDLHRTYAVTEQGLYPVIQLPLNARFTPLPSSSFFLYRSPDQNPKLEDRLVVGDYESGERYLIPKDMPIEDADQIISFDMGHCILPFNRITQCIGDNYTSSLGRN